MRHRRYELTWSHLSRGKGEGTELRLYKKSEDQQSEDEGRKKSSRVNPERQRRYGKAGSDNATAHLASTDDTSSSMNRMVIETGYINQINTMMTANP